MYAPSNSTAWALLLCIIFHMYLNPQRNTQHVFSPALFYFLLPCTLHDSTTLPTRTTICSFLLLPPLTFVFCRSTIWYISVYHMTPHYKFVLNIFRPVTTHPHLVLLVFKPTFIFGCTYTSLHDLTHTQCSPPQSLEDLWRVYAMKKQGIKWLVDPQPVTFSINNCVIFHYEMLRVLLGRFSSNTGACDDW